MDDVTTRREDEIWAAAATKGAYDADGKWVDAAARVGARYPAARPIISEVVDEAIGGAAADRLLAERPKKWTRRPLAEALARDDLEEARAQGDAHDVPWEELNPRYRARMTDREEARLARIGFPEDPEAAK